MKRGINLIYRNAAEEFARRVVAALGDKVHSIVLYGSVARKQAKRDSDIDVLVIGADPELRDRVFELADAAGQRFGYEAFISVVYFTPVEISELVWLRSPFVANVMQEGLVLYDDGTFSKLGGRVPARV